MGNNNEFKVSENFRKDFDDLRKQSLREMKEAASVANEFHKVLSNRVLVSASGGIAFVGLLVSVNSHTMQETLVLKLSITGFVITVFLTLISAILDYKFFDLLSRFFRNYSVNFAKIFKIDSLENSDQFEEMAHEVFNWNSQNQKVFIKEFLGEWSDYLLYLAAIISFFSYALILCFIWLAF